MSGTSGPRILVPVGDSVTLRNTVAYVVRELTEAPEDGSVHFVFPTHWQTRRLDEEEAEAAEELIDRIRTWVREDLDLEADEELPLSVTTALIAEDEYLFSYRDYADSIVEYAREHDLDRIVFDPEYNPGGQEPLLSPIEAELDRVDDITYEVAPVERAVRGRQLLTGGINVGTFLGTFVLSFFFYQFLGGFSGTFDYATGAVSAGIVAAILSGITFSGEFRPLRALGTIGRLLVYLPVLLWEVAKANIQVAYIVLHPSLPIDPSVERIRPAVPIGLPVTLLANSITLTPGTVTIDIRDREFYIHTFSQSSRDGLYDGDLERWTRFVFFGRGGFRIASLRERGQADEPADDQESPPAAEEGDPA